MIKINKALLQKSASIIANGGVVAFPTETVYGLGADALNPKAVARIFDIKQRPHFDPLIVHVAKLSDVSKIAQRIPPKALSLMKAFWPGPLTIVLHKKRIVPDLVTSGLSTVAVRMPNHPIALALITASKTPIAAPSANPFGRLSPTRASHVKKYLGHKVDVILDGGKCQCGLESTIIDATGKQLTILRLGALTQQQIQEVLKEKVIVFKKSAHVTPGSLDKHYAPMTKLVLLDQHETYPRDHSKAGYLVFGPRPDQLRGAKHLEFLSREGNDVVAASRLFDCLHRLDKKKLDVIYVKALPQEGLGAAIMDRLIKSANTFKKN